MGSMVRRKGMSDINEIIFDGIALPVTDTVTLGIDEVDGLLYLYVDGQKQGEGIRVGGD